MGSELRVGGAVRENDANVGHFLAARCSRATRCGLETLENRAVLNDCALHRQAVSRKIVVVLGIGDRAFQRLRDQFGGLARDEHQIIDGLRRLAALDGTRDFTHLLRRHARVASEGLNFHVVVEDSDREAGDSGGSKVAPYPFVFYLS